MAAHILKNPKLIVSKAFSNVDSDIDDLARPYNSQRPAPEFANDRECQMQDISRMSTAIGSSIATPMIVHGENTAGTFAAPVAKSYENF
jgi:hypothetical protein